MTQLTHGFIESLVNQARETMEHVAEANAEMRDLTVTAFSPDRHVTVVVGPRGRILELTLDPRIYRNQDSAGLAAKIVDTIQRAGAEVGEREREINASIVPDAEALGEAVGFAPSEIIELMTMFDGGDHDGAAQS
jgi:DNA-binding protein YbaB